MSRIVPGQIAKETARIWTREAIDCYKRGCNCAECNVRKIYFADQNPNPCRMKQVVYELVRKFGAPKEPGAEYTAECCVCHKTITGRIKSDTQFAKRKFLRKNGWTHRRDSNEVFCSLECYRKLHKNGGLFKWLDYV